MRLNTKPPKKARIEIVPMIDTIFFLLVFFMIASLAMTTMRGMPVNLPKSSTAKDRSVVRTDVTVTASGKYYIDKEPVQFEEIRPALAMKARDNPGIVVVINCDRARDWGSGVQVMDEARKAGVQNLMIATQPKN